MTLAGVSYCAAADSCCVQRADAVGAGLVRGDMRFCPWLRLDSEAEYEICRITAAGSR